MPYIKRRNKIYRHMKGNNIMHNKKLIATTLLLTATLAASLTACENKTATKAPEPEVKTETTKSPVELDTEAATKIEEVTTEAVTEAPTEAVTEEVTEAPVEAPVEVVEQPVVEAPAVEVQTEVKEEVIIQEPVQSSKPGIISNKTAPKVTLNADGTVSTPDGTYAGVTAYNEATGHTDLRDPDHLTHSGYLRKEMDNPEIYNKLIDEAMARYNASH